MLSMRRFSHSRRGESHAFRFDRVGMSDSVRAVLSDMRELLGARNDAQCSMFHCASSKVPASPPCALVPSVTS